MSKFTEMWRVTHPEPLTYNERIINSACDIIKRQDKQVVSLENENKKLREILTREIDDGRAEVDDIGAEEWINQTLISS